MDIDQEYTRIKALFAGADEKQLALLDGEIMEAARLRIELDDMHKVVSKSGLIKINPDNPQRQKELPICRLLPKVRANYTNIIFKLSKALGVNVDEEDLGMGEYE